MLSVTNKGSVGLLSWNAVRHVGPEAKRNREVLQKLLRGEVVKSGKTRLLPINTQMIDVALRKESEASDGVIRGRRSKSQIDAASKANNLQVPQEQAYAIADKWAATKWYGFVWTMFRRLDPQKMHQMRVACHFVMSGLMISAVAVLYWAYREEVANYRMMEERDRVDYKKVMFGARYSDAYKVATAALDAEDPLRTLPKRKQLALVVQAFRNAGYVDKDWELDRRKRDSLIRRPDIMHMFYWTAMYIGRLTSGDLLLF